MELKEFIKTTLISIVDGVKEAQQGTGQQGAMIAPIMPNHLPYQQTHDIHFDIALSENSEQGTKGGIGVFLSAVSLGAQGESSNKIESLSRISFDVPVMLPRLR